MNVLLTCFIFWQLPCVKNTPVFVAEPEPRWPDWKPAFCVNADENDATSFAPPLPLPFASPTMFPFAIEPRNVADALPLEPRTRSVPSSQPRPSVVLTTLRARISTGPLSRGSLLVAVPVYVAVVS